MLPASTFARKRKITLQFITDFAAEHYYWYVLIFCPPTQISSRVFRKTKK